MAHHRSGLSWQRKSQIPKYFHLCLLKRCNAVRGKPNQDNSGALPRQGAMILMCIKLYRAITDLQDTTFGTASRGGTYVLAIDITSPNASICKTGERQHIVCAALQVVGIPVHRSTHIGVDGNCGESRMWKVCAQQFNGHPDSIREQLGISPQTTKLALGVRTSRPGLLPSIANPSCRGFGGKRFEHLHHLGNRGRFPQIRGKKIGFTRCFECGSHRVFAMTRCFECGSHRVFART